MKETIESKRCWGRTSTFVTTMIVSTRCSPLSSERYLITCSNVSSTWFTRSSTLISRSQVRLWYFLQILRCRQIGINAIIILEQIHELDTLLAVSKKLGIEPVIGVRARLTTRHEGHWGTTSGDRAKFGLRPAEIVSAVETLSEQGKLHQLQLLHFHAGSQVRTSGSYWPKRVHIHKLRSKSDVSHLQIVFCAFLLSLSACLRLVHLSRMT